MEPTTVFAIASAILNGIGRSQQTAADVRAIEGQADASAFNAIMSRLTGELSLQSSTSSQLAQRRGARQLMASQRAAIAQAGIGTGGSAADVVEQSATAAELDALNIAHEGRIRFLSALTQADLEDMNAASLRRTARQTKSAGRLATAGSLLSGASMLFGPKVLSQK